MDNQVFTGQQEQDGNFQLTIIGRLAHDAILFDRTCPTCRKRWYSSREYTMCPKCGGALGYILTSDNVPLSISEGTVYPTFGPNRDEEIRSSLTKGSNKLQSIYRYKLFHRADDHGILTPPPEHDRCKVGAKVEVRHVGRPLEPKWFYGKDKLNASNPNKVVWIEQGMIIFTNRGGYVKVLSAQEYVTKTAPDNTVPTPPPVAQPTDASAVVQQLDASITAMEQQIAAAKAIRAGVPVPPPAQPVATPDATPPWEEQSQAASVGGVIDPFANAK